MTGSGTPVSIAVVRARYNPYGGAERFVQRAFAALAAQGVELTIVARDWPRGTQETQSGRDLAGAVPLRFLRVDPFYLGSVWRDWSFARGVRAAKRGGGAVKVPVDGIAAYDPSSADEFLVLHDALDRLAAVDERKARVIELRYFGGLTLEETAEMIGVSVATAHREQRMAEAWLTSALAG